MGDDDRGRPRLAGRPPTRIVADTVVVAAACAVVIGLSGSPLIGGALPQPVAEQVLTLAAAATAAAASLLGSVASRLLGDPRSRWIAAALSLYAVVVLPTSAFVATTDLSVRSARLVAYLATIGLLLASIRPPPGWGATRTWAAAALGAGAAVVALRAPEVAPGFVRAVVEGPVATVAALIGWTGVAAAVVIEGYRRRCIPRCRAGLGLVVVAGAQLHRVLTVDAASPMGDMVFAGLRLLGLAIVLVGFAQLVVRTLSTMRHEQDEQQEELSTAAVHMERAAELAAERDHELRNGLAGLAGITHLLSSQAEGADHERLRHAVLAELTRLHTILDGGMLDEGDLDGAGARTEYAVEPVVTGLAALRRSAGSPIDLDVEPGLQAFGDSAVLAQVVTNLLANCQRHAPGAPVTIRAYRRDAAAVVEVRDEGPGLAPGASERVLERGVRDEAAGGTGLGLHISAQLIEREGGTLALRTVEDPRGCLATVTVPAVTLPSAAPSNR
jgi:two-component system OmpR family sensor kinase